MDMILDGTTKKLLAALLAGTMVFAAAACGGDGDDPEVVESSSDTGSDSGDLDDLDLGILGDEECANVGLAYATISLGALGAMFGGAMDDGELDEMEQELEDLEAEVPDQIADDFEVIRGAFAEFGEALGDGGGNIMDPEYQEQLEEAGAVLESDEVMEAQSNIEAWLTENCEGFDASDLGS